MRRLLLALSCVAACAAPRTTPVPAAGVTHLLVLNKGEATASLIALGSGRVEATMPVGEGPHEVAVRPDGRIAVACNYGTGPAPGRTLTVLDLATRRAVRTIDLGRHRRPHGIAWLPDARRVVVTVEADSAVLVVDVERGVVERAIRTDQAGTHMLVVAPDGRRVHTANLGSGSVSLLDVVAGTHVRTTVTGRFPEAMDLSPDGRTLWVADRILEKVTLLDATTLDTLRSMPTGKFPNRLKFTPDGRTALVSNAQSSSVGFYDVTTTRPDGALAIALDTTLARTQMLGAQMRGSAVPLGIVIDPTGTRAYVALAAMDRIAEVALPTRTVVRLLQAGREPDGMALVALPR
jgi:DNA-binding beta-propeller fold protein YncE